MCMQSRRVCEGTQWQARLASSSLSSLPSRPVQDQNLISAAYINAAFFAFFAISFIILQSRSILYKFRLVGGEPRACLSCNLHAIASQVQLS